MPDDNKKPLNKIEQQRFSSEKEVEKEHFLETGYEQEFSPEKAGEALAEDEVSEQEDIFGEAGADGDDLVSRGAYNQQQAARQLEIEKILEKDLGDIYVNLPPAKQQQFKITGEETAGAISDLFNKGKVKLKFLIELIRKWLILIPGVNKFFLEQEAKIKADEIMKLKDKDI